MIYIYTYITKKRRKTYIYTCIYTYNTCIYIYVYLCIHVYIYRDIEPCRYYVCVYYMHAPWHRAHEEAEPKAPAKAPTAAKKKSEATVPRLRIIAPPFDKVSNIFQHVIYHSIYICIYGNVPLIRDTGNTIKCIFCVFGSNTVNYSMNYFMFLFVSL